VFNSHISTFEEKTWKDVHVGDVIMVKKDEYFPADLLFLSAENPEGICYVETMQLDGETNLKIKKSLDQTKDLTYNTISSFAGMVTCEPPNSRLYQFTGNFEVQPPLVQHAVTLPLSPAAILLRGCSLRNTSRVFGLVIYAGVLATMGIEHMPVAQCQAWGPPCHLEKFSFFNPVALVSWLAGAVLSSSRLGVTSSTNGLALGRQ